MSRPESRPGPTRRMATRSEGSLSYSCVHPNRDAVLPEVLFDVPNAHGAEVEEASSKDGVGPTGLQRFEEVLVFAGSARRDHGDVDGSGDGFESRTVICASRTRPSP